MRAVLDPSVLISALPSPNGAPADLLRALDRGEFELITSQPLLDELGRALAYPKLRRRISKQDAEAFVGWVLGSATSALGRQPEPTIRSPDPGDDYLIGLAASERAALVSGDKHLLDLANEIPVFSPREFLQLLAKCS